MKNIFISILFLWQLMPHLVFAGVRTVEVKDDQIIGVKTALGIATLIQVPDRPNSVVLGDQEAFRVEYLDRAITVKPLHGGAKSNLYIYTDWKRYNIALSSASKDAADYVVYLAAPKPKQPESHLKWKRYQGHLVSGNLRVQTKRIGQAPSGTILIEFQISADLRETIKPEWIWVTQNGKTKPIQKLFLSALKLDISDSASGVIQLQKDDLEPNAPLRIELRRKGIKYLTIPKGLLWQ